MNEYLVQFLTSAVAALKAHPNMDDWLIHAMAGVGCVLVAYHSIEGMFAAGSAVKARINAPKEAVATERDHLQAENEYLAHTVAELHAKLGLPAPAQTVTLQIEHPKPGDA